MQYSRNNEKVRLRTRSRACVALTGVIYATLRSLLHLVLVVANLELLVCPNVEVLAVVLDFANNS